MSNNISSATNDRVTPAGDTAGERWYAPPEMVDGYRDGLSGAPEPGDNRSHSYRHGWISGDADRRGKPAWDSVEAGMKAAQMAISADNCEEVL